MSLNFRLKRGREKVAGAEQEVTTAGWSREGGDSHNGVEVIVL